MPIRRALLAIGLGCVVAPFAVTWSSAQEPARSTLPSSVAFDRDIRPILETHCLSCHSAALRVSRLDLSSREGALTGGAKGVVLVPGDAEHSRLYRMVAGLDRPAMPMQGSRSNE